MTKQSNTFFFRSVCSDDVFIYRNADLEAYVNGSVITEPLPIVNRSLQYPRRNVEVYALQDDMFVSVGGESCAYSARQYFGK